MNKRAYNSYNYGSTARKLTYPEGSEPSSHQKLINNNKSLTQKRAKAKFKVVMLVFGVFLCCLSIIYRYAMITHLNYEADNLTAQYNKIKNENLKLKIQINHDTDLAKIKQIAEEKFSMQAPDQRQIVYVRVPKNDFTKVASAYEYSSEAR